MYGNNQVIPQTYGTYGWKIEFVKDWLYKNSTMFYFAEVLNGCIAKGGVGLVVQIFLFFSQKYEMIVVSEWWAGGANILRTGATSTHAPFPLSIHPFLPRRFVTHAFP